MVDNAAQLMNPVLRTVTPDTNLTEVAGVMRDADVGDVVVTEGNRLNGLLTDRDIVVRCLIDGGGPDTVRAGDVCSSELVTVPPQSSVKDAVHAMRTATVRRLPVVEGDEVVGVVTMGGPGPGGRPRFRAGRRERGRTERLRVRPCPGSAPPPETRDGAFRLRESFVADPAGRGLRAGPLAALRGQSPSRLSLPSGPTMSVSGGAPTMRPKKTWSTNRAARSCGRALWAWARSSAGARASSNRPHASTP